MAQKEIRFSADGRQRMFRDANLIANAVKATVGPKGHNAVGLDSTYERTHIPESPARSVSIIQPSRAELVQRASDRIASGALPSSPAKIFGKFAETEPCALCDGRIGMNEVVYEFAMEADERSRAIHLHPHCERIWRNVCQDEAERRIRFDRTVYSSCIGSLNLTKATPTPRPQASGTQRPVADAL